MLEITRRKDDHVDIICPIRFAKTLSRSSSSLPETAIVEAVAAAGAGAGTGGE